MDVYGLRNRKGNTAIELFRYDVLVPPGFRAGGQYRSLPSNPDSRHGRLLIDQEIGSAEFDGAIAGLEALAVELHRGHGPDTVPRNAALRLTFPETASFEGGPQIELLDAEGTPLLARITKYGNVAVIDPVLLGTEALRLGVDGSAGMPEGDIRLRVAGSEWRFRAAGTIPHDEPPWILGEMKMYVERVARMRDDTMVLTVFTGGIRQAIDRGDVLRVCDGKTGRVIAALEVLRDALQPEGLEPNHRVHVMVRADREQDYEGMLELPTAGSLAGFSSKSGPDRDRFVMENAPSVILLARFENGDDPGNFIRFSPGPVTDTNRNRQDVPPRGACVIRFSSPIDPASLASSLSFADADSRHVVSSRVFVEDAGGDDVPAGTPPRVPLDT